MKELIDKLNKCFINNGNARHIDYKSAEKILKHLCIDIASKAWLRAIKKAYDPNTEPGFSKWIKEYFKLTKE